MKTILWLIAGIAFSLSALAQENKREHLKCYLQLEDKSDIVHYFVNTEKVNKEFIETLTELPVFMADGVTEKTIITVYECVEIKASFRNKDAITLEKNTPF
jgi:hypothetical protein